MPKFKVIRGRDAWTIEEAIVEVDGIETPEAAEEWASWNSNAATLDWKDTGDVRTFDDTKIMEGEAELVEEPAKFSVTIRWGKVLTDSEPETYTFDTPAELDAFLKGINAMDGWLGFEIIEEEDTADE